MTKNNPEAQVQGIESIEEQIVKGDALRSEPDQVKDISPNDHPQNEGYQSACRE